MNLENVTLQDANSVMPMILPQELAKVSLGIQIYPKASQINTFMLNILLLFKFISWMFVIMFPVVLVVLNHKLEFLMQYFSGLFCTNGQRVDSSGNCVGKLKQ